MEYDLIIIGGGAAGLMAAGTAASAGAKVVLLEKMEKPARKVRITGKGRCNLTNIRPAEEFLAKIQANREFFAPAYAEFDNRALVKFFERLGVRLSTEQGGRVFPKSGKAWDIAEALVEWCREAGVEIICHAAVCEILLLGNRVRGVNYKTKKGFLRRAEAPAVVLCTGGASYPATGSTGDGYALAHALGHTIEPVRPSLVPLETSMPDREFLYGLHLRNISAKLLLDGTAVAEEFGEMSFSPRGVEGAVVLRMSRTAVDAPMADLLRRLVPKELVMPIAKAVGGHPKRLLRQAAPEMAETLIRTLKDFRIPVSDYRPFEEAIVTAGGITVSEVNPATMESRLVRGLYFAGEVLDLDANTGGYNLQIAFSTGRLAGRLKHEE